jgi:hypothetical protein
MCGLNELDALLPGHSPAPPPNHVSALNSDHVDLFLCLKQLCAG